MTGNAIPPPDLDLLARRAKVERRAPVTAADNAAMVAGAWYRFDANAAPLQFTTTAFCNDRNYRAGGFQGEPI
jgi:hypothetical protein